MLRSARIRATLGPLFLCLLAGCLSRGKSTMDVPLGDGVIMQMVRLERGRFLMGSPKSEQEKVRQAIVDVNKVDGGKEESRPRAKGDWVVQETQHEVEISRAFYIGMYEVTQAQYEALMRHNPSSFSSTGPGKELVKGQDTSWFPVDSVPWEDALEFCKRLSGKDGRHFDLPTEAEWEYACRAGSSGLYAFGNTLSSRQANYFGVTQATMPVGSFEPNAFGLYDMHGNVAEWCKDWYDRDYYTKSARVDPSGPPAGTYRVLRGGCCFNPTVFCRSAARDFDRPSQHGNYQRGDVYGFRVVLRE